MRILSLDLETYSGVDLTKCGVYAYAGSPGFEILLLAYAFDDEPVTIIDLASGEQIPDEVLEALTDPNTIKTAFSANFERTCLARYLNTPMPPEQWRCSQAHALTLGLPAGLEGVAKCLKLPQQKMSEGKGLIRYFSMPCKPTKTNSGRTRNLPEHDPEKWELFRTYCKQDVEVERSIRQKLNSYPMLEQELKLWFLDQRINDYGVRVDMELVKNAIRCDEMYQEKLVAEARHLTGLENPNSPARLKGWLEDKHGIQIESLARDTVAEILEEVANPIAKRALELRQEMSRTSVKKYEAMKRAVCSDDRVRGLLQYYGANRTGRFSGKLVQIHNLPRNNMSDLDLARQLLSAGDYEALELLFESIPGVLSQLIRTAFIASPGHRFIVSDFSAIEARIVAWLAGERWRLDVFNTHGKIYEASAAQMFGVPVENITKGSELRQKGKIAELGLGYQGSVGALKSMGALKMGLKEEDLPEIVAAWRKANPKIVKLWRDLEEAAIRAVKDRTIQKLQRNVKLYYKAGVLFMQLPSGRSLAYVRPRIELDERFGKDKLTYEGVELGKWCRIDTYGGKLAENLTQAIARDCLAESLLRLDAAGYKIAFHVHDEVVLDVPCGFGSLKEVEAIMSEPIDWAPGLSLGAAGFETDYYMKD
ncbi:DNA polymerase [Desulfolucanica intricata]|uniref:DNA polymerase n=1 Tax=Desulfolucanica intricata TaxID=1285191 RepID=UPI000836FB3B|nr:DNA polymerase [Desulfolucanica intricata]